MMGQYIKLIWSRVVVALIFVEISFAQEYTPLSGIPWLKTDKNMIDYVNFIYSIAIFFGSIAAVMIIAYSGLRYMTTDIPNMKTDAKHKIVRAIIGLVLLLGAHLILRFINPDLVELRLLNRTF